MGKLAKVIIISSLALIVTFTGCKNNPDAINVISRESGSGTRGAFIELFGIEKKDAEGNKQDKTTTSAVQLNGTQQIMSNVQGDKNAIGYISLGSLNDTVKALKIDGAEANAANIKNGTYKVSRPFNIATKDQLSDVAKDFINYILSSDGQAVVEKGGYIKASENGTFTSNNAKGKVVVAGSSSVTPIMEKLKEAYVKINTGAEVEIHLSDSSSGMQSTKDGTCDIGMASRELKDSEKAELTATVIALDGIAVIVNKNNSIDSMTSEQVKDIFTGAVTSWSEIS